VCDGVRNVPYPIRQAAKAFGVWRGCVCFLFADILRQIESGSD
jgi:hypothetical protein